LPSSGQEGYTPSTAPPDGGLPNTGASLIGPAELGGGLLLSGLIIFLAARNGLRQARPRPGAAPDYLRDKTGRDPDDPRYSA
jgi:hypothetical protein